MSAQKNFKKEKKTLDYMFGQKKISISIFTLNNSAQELRVLVYHD